MTLSPGESDPRRLLEACAAIEALHDQFVRERPAPGAIPAFEADAYSWALTMFVSRCVEGVITMARHDRALAPAATVAARAALEAGVRVLWLLSPDDPIERESRFLAFLAKGIREKDRLVKAARSSGYFDAADAIVESVRSRQLHYEELRTSLENAAYPIHPEEPSFREMLATVDSPETYLAYMVASDFTHSGWGAMQAYGPGLGIDKLVGEFSSPRAWTLCLHMCLLALESPLSRALELWNGNPSNYPEPLTAQAAEDAIQILGTS